MNKLVAIALLSTLFNSSFSQSQYETVVEPSGTKILKGVITKDVIAKDTSFKWFANNQKNFVPDAAAVASLKNNGAGLQFLVFGGTWCEDTQLLLPRYFSWLQAVGFPDERVTLIGVDRSKKTIGHLAEALGVTNVPTFIVLKNGKELGRVVEFGKYGAPDKELGELIEKNRMPN
jgi:thiol-disulfide isomerase/thioredoxin